ncbi:MULTISPECIES: FCD domain-containing protein [Pseudomonas]|uniref:FCD domain-containing protein n=1 Tax=Pseudomonas TaxID=286 RepID=UPI00159FBA6B|nr:GntR family transcriptional regulator [Pseudomonas gingeri]NVZ60645.1 GntR family transcriptional regulator [Pseudomonas gingeri]NVZ76790.1 GntR family transcriptional regulator [Pseudomonas gingeri]NWA11552.1 GntR family transcriptional regulator [Pseudomonas gingeri]NWE45224.1 GntR family transcriptional regulator [Pseudomonas gingeri]
MQIQPLEQGNLSARAYYSLREGLIAGNFQPGERLVMQDLAERLGTSVTPVREACLRLVSERGLELRSGRFATVPALTRERYLEVRTIRIALEGLAAEMATQHVTEADLQKLAQLHSLFEEADRKNDGLAAMHHNREFHFTLYRLSGMDMLTAQIEGLWVSMGPILNLFYTFGHNSYIGADEHLVLMEALRDKKPAKARKAIADDILRGGVSILKFIDEKEKRPA